MCMICAMLNTNHFEGGSYSDGKSAKRCKQDNYTGCTAFELGMHASCSHMRLMCGAKGNYKRVWRSGRV